MGWFTIHRAQSMIFVGATVWFFAATIGFILLILGSPESAENNPFIALVGLLNLVWVPLMVFGFIALIICLVGGQIAPGADDARLVRYARRMIVSASAVALLNFILRMGVGLSETDFLDPLVTLVFDATAYVVMAIAGIVILSGGRKKRL